MEDNKISALNSASNVQGTDLLVIVNENQTRKITVDSLFTEASDIKGSIRLQGDWDATSSNPPVSSITPIPTGFAWRVSVDGNTNLGGITEWGVGDLAVKTDNNWLKINSKDIGAVWGNIKGNVSNQTDLIDYFDDRFETKGQLDSLHNLGLLQGNIDDLGKTWLKVDVDATHNKEFQAVYHVISLGNGVVIAGSYGNYVNPTYGIKVFRSTDYGKTFPETIVLDLPAGNVTTFQLLYLGDGIVLCGSGSSNGNGNIFRSTDYGKTWGKIVLNSSLNITECFCDLGNGVVLCGSGGDIGEGIIWKSTDFGVTWTNKILSPNSTVITSISYLGNNKVICSSDDNLYQSNDAGETWTLLRTVDSQINATCYFGNGIIAIGTESGKLHRSPDFGATWTIKSASTSIRFITYIGCGVAFYSSSGPAKIFKTKDNGSHWEEIITPFSGVEDYAVKMSYAGNGLLFVGVGSADPTNPDTTTNRPEVYRSSIIEPNTAISLPIQIALNLKANDSDLSAHASNIQNPHETSLQQTITKQDSVPVIGEIKIGETNGNKLLSISKDSISFDGSDGHTNTKIGTDGFSYGKGVVTDGGITINDGGVSLYNGSNSISINYDGTIKGLLDSPLANSAVTRGFVESLTLGLKPHAPVKIMLEKGTDINTFIANGHGVGKTLTAVQNGVFQYQGVSFGQGDRIGLSCFGYQRIDAGIYDLTVVGDENTPWVLTRSTDFDGSSTNETKQADILFVQEGRFAQFMFIETQKGSEPNTGNLIIDTDLVTWVPFHAPQDLSFFQGLEQNGSYVSVKPDITTGETIIPVSVSSEGVGVAKSALQNSIPIPTLQQAADAGNIINKTVIIQNISNGQETDLKGNSVEIIDLNTAVSSKIESTGFTSSGNAGNVYIKPNESSLKNVNVNNTKITQVANGSNSSDAVNKGQLDAIDKTAIGLGNVTNDLQLKASSKGVANGVAELDANGKVPTTQLPSYVDDILEFNTLSSFPTTGAIGKIYISLDTNIIYRWSGSVYVEISQSIALGETLSTAYRGDRGKTAFDHSQTTGANPHITTLEQVRIAGNTLAGDINANSVASIINLKTPVNAGDATPKSWIEAKQINSQYSITGGGNLSANRTLQLVNDSATPSANSIYGANNSGTRGWFNLPPIITAQFNLINGNVCQNYDDYLYFDNAQRSGNDGGLNSNAVIPYMIPIDCLLVGAEFYIGYVGVGGNYANGTVAINFDIKSITQTSVTSITTISASVSGTTSNIGSNTNFATNALAATSVLTGLNTALSAGQMIGLKFLHDTTSSPIIAASIKYVIVKLLLRPKI